MLSVIYTEKQVYFFPADMQTIRTDYSFRRHNLRFPNFQQNAQVKTDANRFADKKRLASILVFGVLQKRRLCRWAVYFCNDKKRERDSSRRLYGE
jgi:hypothetical protein